MCNHVYMAAVNLIVKIANLDFDRSTQHGTFSNLSKQFIANITCKNIYTSLEMIWKT